MANGSKASVSREVQLRLLFGRMELHHKCLVLQGLSYDVILGMDFMFLNDVVVDAKMRKVKISGIDLDCGCDADVSASCILSV